MYKADIEPDIAVRKRKNRLLSTFSPVVNTITAKAAPSPVYSFCHAHDSGYLVDPQGYIYPCIPAVGVEALSIGRYYPEVFFKENSIRNRNIDTIPECGECIYSLLCGGCAVSLYDREDVFKPVCFNIKNQVHNILPAFYRAEREKMTTIGGSRDGTRADSF